MTRSQKAYSSFEKVSKLSQLSTANSVKNMIDHSPDQQSVIQPTSLSIQQILNELDDLFINPTNIFRYNSHNPLIVETKDLPKLYPLDYQYLHRYVKVEVQNSGEMKIFDAFMEDWKQAQSRFAKLLTVRFKIRDRVVRNFLNFLVNEKNKENFKQVDLPACLSQTLQLENHFSSENIAKILQFKKKPLTNMEIDIIMSYGKKLVKEYCLDDEKKQKKGKKLIRKQILLRKKRHSSQKRAQIDFKSPQKPKESQQIPTIIKTPQSQNIKLRQIEQDNQQDLSECDEFYYMWSPIDFEKRYVTELSPQNVKLIYSLTPKQYDFL